MQEILVLYYSQHGAVKQLAQLIARGWNPCPAARRGCAPCPKSPPCAKPPPQPSRTLAHYVEPADLVECAGLALGSPTRFGNMAAAMKYFSGWQHRFVAERRAGRQSRPVFHQFVQPARRPGKHPAVDDAAALHHGMLLVGLPYSEPALSATQTGGTPHGVSHGRANNDRPISDDERKLAIAQGKRLAEVALKLRG